MYILFSLLNIVEKYSLLTLKNAQYSPSYFAKSYAGTPISIIRQNIKQQNTPD